MFTAPPVLHAEVFACIPESLRKTGQLSPERLAAGKGSRHTHSQIEGPVFDTQGNLWIVDIAFGRILRIDPAGHFDVAAEYDGEPNGLKFHPDGTLYIADHKRGLLTLDVASSTVTPLHTRFRTEAFKGLNDLCLDRAGNLWFADQGQTGLQDPSGRVFRLALDGRVDCQLANVPSPNGIVMNPAENMLYVAATRFGERWYFPTDRSPVLVCLCSCREGLGLMASR